MCTANLLRDVMGSMWGNKALGMINYGSSPYMGKEDAKTKYLKANDKADLGELPLIWDIEYFLHFIQHTLWGFPITSFSRHLFQIIYDEIRKYQLNQGSQI